MDLFFEIWLYLKNEYFLSRIVRITMKDGIEIKIYSGNDLIVIVKGELDQIEWAYLTAGIHLIDWTKRYDHASSSTREGVSWLKKLKEQLGEDDEQVDNAEKRW